jgi:hypothetical protein
MAVKSAKMVFTWIVGGVFLLIGTWIVQNLDFNVVGVSEVSYAMAMAVALVMFLLTGLCWISVSVATRQK